MKRILFLLSFALPLAALAQLVEFDGAKAIQYKQVGDTKLFLHVFLPKGKSTGGKRPAIVFFFGLPTRLPDSTNTAAREILSLFSTRCFTRDTILAMSPNITVMANARATNYPSKAP